VQYILYLQIASVTLLQLEQIIQVSVVYGGIIIESYIFERGAEIIR
jgi:hypothetical protein